MESNCYKGFMFKKKKKKTQPPFAPPLSRHIPFSDILKATNNFDESLVIERGDFGDVYKGEFFNGKTHVLASIKRLNALAMQGRLQPWPPLDVIGRLTTFSHRNLASLIGYCIEVEEVKKSKNNSFFPYRKETILVYEYVPNGTLKDHLHVYNTPLSWVQRLNICTDIARALHYLHTQPETGADAATLMHGDIKSSNILLTESLTAKVSEFGLSKLAHLSDQVTLPAGCFGYLDAFSLHSGRLTRNSDVYSFGVLLLEMLFRMPVIHNSKPEMSIFCWFPESVKNGTVEERIDPVLKNEVSSDCLKILYTIADRCLNHRPEQRPQITDLLNTLESSVLRDPSNHKGKVPDVPRPRVWEFKIDDLEKATEGFSSTISKNVFLGWVDEYSLAPSDEDLGMVVAVKRIISDIPQPYNEWLEKVSLLREMNHPNIIEFLGWCNKNEHEHLLIYVYKKHKSLSDLIHHGEPLSWKERLEIMKGVATAVEYLYTKKGVACHFQCCSILVSESFTPRIGGFEWREVHERHDGKRLNGSFGYKPTQDYDTSSGQWLIRDDIICFGWVLLEVITGRRLGDLAPVYVDLSSLEMHAPKSKSNIKKLKKMMDPRLEEGYPLEGALRCMELASRCAADQQLSRAEILWSLEQISHFNK